ncbi:hypothetical protein SMICM17S_02514 [Streptomyces microflavus]
MSELSSAKKQADNINTASSTRFWKGGSGITSSPPFWYVR